MYINDLLDLTWRTNFHLTILTPLIMYFYHLPPSLKVTKILKRKIWDLLKSIMESECLCLYK